MYHGKKIASAEGETRREAKKSAAFIAIEQFMPNYSQSTLSSMCTCNVNHGKVFKKKRRLSE